MVLKNFRNHEIIKINPIKNENLIGIIDGNGTGKTNILEAISLLSPGNGIRSAHLSDIPMQGGTGEFFCSFEVQIGAELTQKIEIFYQNGRKKITINEKPVSSQIELKNILGLIWITPEIQMAIASSNTERRKFFDRSVFNFKAEHATLLNNYDKLIRERLKILELSQNFSQNSWLDSIEKQIAELSIEISKNRTTCLEEIQKNIMEMSLAISLEINCAVIDTIKFNPADCIKIIENKLAQSRKNDANAARTLFGCHRYQVNLKYLTKNADIEMCSSGEKKYTIMSLLLAIAKSIAHHTNHAPIVLIDEFTSFIDSNLRQILLNKLLALNCQIWFTGVEVPVINYDAKYYSISALVP